MVATPTPVPPSAGFAAAARSRAQSWLLSYWRSIVGIFALVVFAVIFILLLGQLGLLDLSFMAENWTTYAQPAILSLWLTSLSFVLGFSGAIALGLIRAYAPRIARTAGAKSSEVLSFKRARELHGSSWAIRLVLRRSVRKGLHLAAYGITTGYVEGIRGTPFLVQMFLVFFLVLALIPTYPGVFIVAGLIALTINTLGYQAEVLRGGIQSVGQGQVDAAKAIGMKGRSIFAHITLPQAVRLIILPLTNEWISLFKVSTLLSIISVTELMFQTKQLGVNEGHPIEAFVMVAIIYLLIIVPLSRTITYIEARTRIPGLGVPTAGVIRPRFGRPEGG